jgi:hypothetical protein
MQSPSAPNTKVVFALRWMSKASHVRYRARSRRNRGIAAAGDITIPHNDIGCGKVSSYKSKSRVCQAKGGWTMGVEARTSSCRAQAVSSMLAIASAAGPCIFGLHSVHREGCAGHFRLTRDLPASLLHHITRTRSSRASRRRSAGEMYPRLCCRALPIQLCHSR